MRKLGDAKVAKYAEIGAVCHTVVTEKAANGELKMEAESPDELALVQAAVDMDWSFQQRINDTLKVVATARKRRTRSSASMRSLQQVSECLCSRDVTLVSTFCWQRVQITS